MLLPYAQGLAELSVSDANKQHLPAIPGVIDSLRRGKLYIRHWPTEVPVVSRSSSKSTKGPVGTAVWYMNGLAWNKQSGDPRRSGPATSRPLESTMELACVI